jgi:small nuclear ribonucleoprotein (snRNP)-like protein
VTVELKNDLAIRGTLLSVDQYLNIKLENTRVVDQDKFPHMVISRFFFLILQFYFRVLVLNVYLATTTFILQVDS